MGGEVVWLMLLTALAAADEEALLERIEEPVRVGRFHHLAGDGPARPWQRRAQGRYLVWTLPGNLAIELVELRGRRELQRRRWDASGLPFSTVSLQDGQPHDLTLHGAEEVALEVAGWTAVSLGPARLHLPPDAEVDEDEARATLPDRSRVHLQWHPTAEEPLAMAWQQAFLEGCGCAAAWRRPVWIEGRPGLRIGLSGATPGAEAWLLPGPDGVLVGLLEPAEPPLGPFRGPGLAPLALLRWEDP